LGSATSMRRRWNRGDSGREVRELGGGQRPGGNDRRRRRAMPPRVRARVKARRAAPATPASPAGTPVPVAGNWATNERTVVAVKAAGVAFAAGVGAGVAVGAAGGSEAAVGAEVASGLGGAVGGRPPATSGLGRVTGSDGLVGPPMSGLPVVESAGLAAWGEAATPGWRTT